MNQYPNYQGGQYPPQQPEGYQSPPTPGYGYAAPNVYPSGPPPAGPSPNSAYQAAYNQPQPSQQYTGQSYQQPPQSQQYTQYPAQNVQYQQPQTYPVQQQQQQQPPPVQTSAPPKKKGFFSSTGGKVLMGLGGAAIAGFIGLEVMDDMDSGDNDNVADTASADDGGQSYADTGSGGYGGDGTDQYAANAYDGSGVDTGYGGDGSYTTGGDGGTDPATALALMDMQNSYATANANMIVQSGNDIASMY